MTFLMGLLVFIYGTIFGSFYNVIIYRLPLDMNIAKGRSMCTSCNTTLRAKDLIPLISWLSLRGRCRYCGSKISLRYPIVEGTTGLLFLIAYLNFGMGMQFLLYASLYSMLLITALIDWDHMIVSEYVLYVFSAVSIFCMWRLKFPLMAGIWGFIAGFGLYFLIYWAARLLYKKEGFGFGDVELMGAIGIILGFRDTLLAAMLSFYVAMIFILLMKLLGKKVQLRQEIPFGPYICLATFIVTLYGDAMVNFYMRTMF